MVEALLLAVVTAGVSAQGIIKKFYNGKTGGAGVFIFNSLSVFSACLFFVFSSGFKFDFNPQIIPWALGFALCYGASAFAGFLAIMHGPLSLTSLVTSYSLIIPTFYGLIFLDESASAWFWIGLALLCISLFLINSGKKPSAEEEEKKEEGEPVKITLLWAIFALVSFVGNGACSTIQTVQQRTFDGQYKNELMIIALLAVTVIMTVAACFAERKDIIPCTKRGWYWMVLCGVANGVVNLLVMVLSTRMKASLMFPVISAGGIILTWVVSRFLYKEKLSVGQNVALVLGIAAVVFMNL